MGDIVTGTGLSTRRVGILVVTASRATKNYLAAGLKEKFSKPQKRPGGPFQRSPKCMLRLIRLYRFLPLRMRQDQLLGPLLRHRFCRMLGLNYLHLRSD
jgi:hypothetical protein